MQYWLDELTHLWCMQLNFSNVKMQMTTTPQVLQVEIIPADWRTLAKALHAVLN